MSTRCQGDVKASRGVKGKTNKGTTTSTTIKRLGRYIGWKARFWMDQNWTRDWVDAVDLVNVADLVGVVDVVDLDSDWINAVEFSLMIWIILL